MAAFTPFTGHNQSSLNGLAADGPGFDILGASPPDQRPFVAVAAARDRATSQSQQAQQAHARNGQMSRGRLSGDHRNLHPSSGHITTSLNNSGSVPLPLGQAPHAHQADGQQQQQRNATGALEDSRNPPANKNTSHVPCKFFRQGACQAGKACPFSHSTDGTNTQTPCKYFAKGNCKFGAKCALAHILPDGRRVNRPLGGGPLNLGNRVNPETYHNQGSALASSLIQANMVPGPFGHQVPFSGLDDYQHQQHQAMQSREAIPTMDNTGFSSGPGSAYGSPRDDIRLPLSPVFKGLSTLDAPLPASFDSNGVSWFARTGPVAASVPSKFGLESPPHSFKDGPTSDALRNLHDSAFGTDARGKPAGNLASSPPTSNDVPGQRIMHSQRYSKTKVMSTSLPRGGAHASDDWDGNFAFEEDFIPNSLHELLTPQEKMRRLSRSGGDDDAAGQRPSLGGVGIPGETSSGNVGSPPTAASPSRFGPLYTRQRRDDDHAAGPVLGFGHVGSPLRNSSLSLGSSPSARLSAAISRPTSGDVSPRYASPPWQQPSASASMISQQLQRTRINGNNETPNLHPSSAARFSGSSARGLDRAVSTSSSSSAAGVGGGRLVPSIDEEQGEIFSLEEEDDSKRLSGGWNYPVGGRSPRLNALTGGTAAARNIYGGGSQR
ncbi:MAG: hypothetical protein M1825_004209 [Sarcosagium campestre]|nr:MAG: hypothetical protein M1825_004209 [Sarcosagium campestre]